MSQETPFALGKKLGVVQDRRTFRMAELLDVAAMPTVPPKHRVGGKLTSVPMFANDDYGCCTRASQAHAAVTQERSSSQRELPISDDQVLEAYERVSRFRRDGSGVDEGAYELDALNDWRKNGIGLEKDSTPHKIYAFAAVDWRDLRRTVAAHYAFGGLKVCAGLPLTAADQSRAGKDWDLVHGTPRNRWGSWGGHSMYSHAYDLRRGIAVWTWGREQWMSWPWVHAYVDETYAVISEDYIRRGGTTPQGFNRQRLDELLSAL
jgi:hypothetical protein